MMEDGRATLNTCRTQRVALESKEKRWHTLVEPLCAVFLFIDRDGKGLTAAVVTRFNESYFESVGMLNKAFSACLGGVSYTARDMTKDVPSRLRQRQQQVLSFVPLSKADVLTTLL